MENHTLLLPRFRTLSILSLLEARTIGIPNTDACTIEHTLLRRIRNSQFEVKRYIRAFFLYRDVKTKAANEHNLMPYCQGKHNELIIVSVTPKRSNSLKPFFRIHDHSRWHQFDNLFDNLRDVAESSYHCYNSCYSGDCLPRGLEKSDYRAAGP